MENKDLFEIFKLASKKELEPRKEAWSRIEIQLQKEYFYKKTKFLTIGIAASFTVSLGIVLFLIITNPNKNTENIAFKNKSNQLNENKKLSKNNNDEENLFAQNTIDKTYDKLNNETIRNQKINQKPIIEINNFSNEKITDELIANLEKKDMMNPLEILKNEDTIDEEKDVAETFVYNDTPTSDELIIEKQNEVINNSKLRNVQGFTAMNLKSKMADSSKNNSENDSSSLENQKRKFGLIVIRKKAKNE